MTTGNANNLISTSNPALLTKEIQDIYTKKNFESLVTYFTSQNQLLGFNFFELNITAATTATQSIKHNLAYTPKDVVVTQATGTGQISFLYGKFDSTFLYYTASGPCRIRFFVGSYFNDTSKVTAGSTDYQAWGPQLVQSSTVSLNNKSGTYTVKSTDKTILIDASVPNAPIVYLPLASTVSGNSYTFTKTDTSANTASVFVSNGSTDLINGSLALITLFSRYHTVTLTSTGSGWLITAKNFQNNQTVSSNYTLTYFDDTVFIASNNTCLMTLPDALIMPGKVFTLKKISAGVAVVQIFTTAGQSIDGRASGLVALNRLNDFITVESTIISGVGTWKILDKKETEIKTASTSGQAISASSTNIYLAGSPSVILTAGQWRISGIMFVQLNVGTNGLYVTLNTASGFFAAAGAGNSTPPLSILSTGTFDGVTIQTGNIQCVSNGTGGGGVTYTFPPFTWTITATNTIFLVLNVTTPASGTGIWAAQITAERIW